LLFAFRGALSIWDDAPPSDWKNEKLIMIVEQKDIFWHDKKI
jgi:hypothetical protein